MASTQPELGTAFDQVPTDKNGASIPVRVEKCGRKVFVDPPPRLDLSGESKTADELLKWLSEERANVANATVSTLASTTASGYNGTSNQR